MEIIVSQGQNIIRLLSDDFISCLVIEQALAAKWPDCRGSIGEYYALSNYTSEKRQKLTQELNELLSKGDEKEILSSMPSFLSLFPNGKYLVDFCNLSIKTTTFQYEDQVRYADIVPDNQRFSGSIYPNFDLEYYFYTIPKQSIDTARVDHYCKLISAGKRPKAIVHLCYDSIAAANGGDEYTASYVLDGHHKIEAYRALKIDIPVVAITKYEVERSHTEDIMDLLYPMLKDFEFKHIMEHNRRNTNGLNFRD